MTDLLIRDVDVVDGTGAASYRADVLVDKGRITEIASPRTLSGADKTIAPESGYVLAPGFIDMHAHSDLRLLTDPGHFPKVSQGVTTEVIGQDGISYAPIDDVALDIVRRQIAGWNGNPSDLDFSWRSVADYLDRLDQGITPNAAYLVPQGTLRLLAVGADQRPATPTEIDRMQELLAQGLSEGAVGMSSGLTYTPGMYADTAELAALCEVVAEFGGFYAPHTRSYGAGALEAYAEMIELSRGNPGAGWCLTLGSSHALMAGSHFDQEAQDELFADANIEHTCMDAKRTRRCGFTTTRRRSQLTAGYWWGSVQPRHRSYVAALAR